MSALDERDMKLVRLFTACVLGNWDEVRRVRASASANAGEPDRRWREAVLQVHVFAGFPRLVEAYGVLGSLGEFDADELDASRDVSTRGTDLFTRIYAGDATEVRAMLERHHPDFARFILAHAYGAVLARPGLSADRRELLAVAALAALGQERQLASHARGAVRLGAKPAEVHAVLDAIADLVDASRLEDARRVVERFAPL